MISPHGCLRRPVSVLLCSAAAQAGATTQFNTTVFASVSDLRDTGATAQGVSTSHEGPGADLERFYIDRSPVRFALAGKGDDGP